MEMILSTDHLTKRYGNETAVNDLSLSIPEGSVYGFLGPNGAGKTTTLKMALGLAHPTSGEVRVFGRPMDAKNRLDILKNVGSLIESPSFYGHLTARENLEIHRRLRNLPLSAIDDALITVRLDHTGNKLAGKFSLGMKQRLGIAAALMGHPSLMLLDEPTNGLDPAGIQEIRSLVKTLAGREGMTLLVSSHLLGEIDQFADHVGVISHGKLVFQDTMAALHARSARKIFVHTSDDERARGLLPDSQAVDGGLTLNDMDDGKAAAVSIMLAKHDIGVARMELRQKTLEELFLEMTQSEAKA